MNLINSGTQNFFGNTTFETRYIYATSTGSYKFTPSMTLILAFNVTILSWSIPSDASIIVGVAVGVDTADCMKAGFCCRS